MTNSFRVFCILAGLLGSTEASAQALVSRNITVNDPVLAAFGVKNRNYLLSDGRINCAPGETPVLVVALHGASTSAQSAADMMGLHLAGRCGLVAYPNGTRQINRRTVDVASAPASWNSYGTVREFFAEKAQVDDLGFLSALIDALASEFHLPRRAWITGISNGGSLAYMAACRLDGRVAAVAPVAAALRAAPTECDGPLLPLPLLHVHGIEDATAPWDGDATHPPVQDGIDLWAAANGCSDVIRHVPPVIVGHHEYVGCAAPVGWYEVQLMGHIWQKTGFDTTSVVWDFFAEHP